MCLFTSDCHACNQPLAENCSELQLSCHINNRIAMHKSSDPQDFTCPAGLTHCPLQERVAELENRCRELEKLVERDPLTGLYNYRFLTRVLTREMDRTRRNGFPFGLIMLDIDGFKQINDTLGHEAGNCVIREVASLLEGHTRQSDLVCRYGGDEFAVILPGAGPFRAVNTAERLCRMFENSAIDTCGNTVRITVSAGVSVFNSDCRDSPEDFITRADRLLLEAKKQGKNRVSDRDKK